LFVFDNNKTFFRFPKFLLKNTILILLLGSTSYCCRRTECSKTRY